MAALEYDLVINQGETWSIAFPVMDGAGAPLVVDGWHARAQVRPTISSAAVFEWNNTTAANAIVSGTSVQLKLDPRDTVYWAFATALYDLELTDPQGGITRIAEGKVILKAEVTR